MWRSFRVGLSGLVLAAAASGTWAADEGASALTAKHESLRQQLADSPFGRPVVVESGESESAPTGDVYAVVKHPFAEVEASLQRSESWCDVMMLQTNVRKCARAGEGATQTLQMSFVRKSEQTLADAQRIDFKYAVKSASSDYLSVKMSAASGPVGTSNYQLNLEAVPAGAGLTFIHLSYSYANGVAARLATQAYLSTSGRSKVGFTVTGKDDAGKPTYVGGFQGIAERNTMRYYLAIESVLTADALPEDKRVESRLQTWWAAVEKYPRQLKEMERADYLAMKKRDLQTPAT